MAQQETENNVDKNTNVKNGEFLGIRLLPFPEPELPITSPDLSVMYTPDEYTLAAIQESILGTAHEVVGVDGITVVYPPDHIFSTDFAVSCQRVARTLDKNPGEVADIIAKQLHSEVFKTVQTSQNGFVNIELDLPVVGGAILRDIESLGERYGEQNIGNGGKVIIDKSSPNTAKEFSIAHMRSTFRGDAIGYLFRACGYTEVTDNHIGDWGTQFGKLGYAFKMWKDEYPILRDSQEALNHPQEAIKALQQIYTRISSEIEIQKKNGSSEIEDAGRDWFSRLEKGDPEAKKMYEWASALSNLEFERMYKLTGSTFNYQLGESFYVPMLPDVYKVLEDRGYAHESDGALIIEFSLPTKEKPTYTLLSSDEAEKLQSNAKSVFIVRKKDDSSIYAARDLATLAMRTSVHPEKIIYVVGGEQSDYFKLLFEAFKTWAGEGVAPELIHSSFGLMTLNGEKMSTRKGNVELLENFMVQAVERAHEIIELKNNERKNEGQSQLTEAEITTIARQIGIGAVKWFDLGAPGNRTIDFTWEKALSLQRGSVYIQYTFARSQSLLKKASERGISINKSTEPVFSKDDEGQKHERKLLLMLGKYPEAVRAALESYEPSKLADYLQKLTDTFNGFYTNVQILSEGDPMVRNTCLRLVDATTQVIKNGLSLLGIEAPEKM
jgi:arginyl-tRNA synthetase